MGTATKSVFEFARENHPLGKSILEEEAPQLATSLRRRLAISAAELDFSPESLKLLEEKLLEWSRKNDINNFADTEIVQLVREIAAYVGKILVLHAKGDWQPTGTLWGTQIIFEGKIKVVKEGRTRVVPSVVFSLGNIGATAVDMLKLDKKPLLYRDYLSARKKTVKEQLGYKGE